jgi:soluble lytic murein transglycosylase
LFDAALVSERDQKIVQAAEFWERVVNEYPNDEQSLQATFLAGFSRYRSGDYPSALPLFQRYLAAATDLEDRAAAYLWQAKTSQVMGDPAGTQTNLELAANTDPTGYYSERARDLLRGIEPFSPPQQYDLGIDLAGERLQAETWMRTTFSLGEEVDLSSPGSLAGDLRFQRGTELWMLGMYEQARLEFEDLRTSLQSDPVGSYLLVNYLYDLGVYRSAILTARQVLNLAGMSDAETMGAPILFNHIRFGTYFSDLILPVAQANDIHPLIVFSLVRQESAFEGFVRSSAGARGLMQIMPATGQEIAADLNWPQGYTNEDLYRPIVSINLGVDYLVEWRDRLGGDMYAALAAYNGGPGNALRWQELAGDDQDVFLEIVRFQETRNYIRSVYEIFNIYRRIYDRTP